MSEKKKWRRQRPDQSYKQELREKEQNEIAELERRIMEESPAPGSLLKKSRKTGIVLSTADPSAQKKKEKESPLSVASSSLSQIRFKDIPLSRKTLLALEDMGLDRMTEIQRLAIPHALAGRDVLGAARTGSGKTLAFLIPMLELLYRKFMTGDGLGLVGLVMTPTRELAFQIFDVLREVGRNHDFSAGLVVGGKDFTSEQETVASMNILVGTPGRILQHLEQSYGLNCDDLSMFVMDEADRCLDLGFEADVNRIVSHLPRSRQTLLFSATQTKSVGQLARLSLKRAEYVAAHADAAWGGPTLSAQMPEKLSQHFTFVEAQEKLETLYSFLRSHVQKKIIVFFSTCKQVRFFYELFCSLRPGIPLLSLTGKMKQMKRMAIFLKFSEAKHCALFCTDVASRGLDFPAIDWVVQFDCPEDVPSYIHRVGRTSRLDAVGRSLLFLRPAEKKFVEDLKKSGIEAKKIKIDPKKRVSITGKVASTVSSDVEKKALAQKAFSSYVRSIHLQANSDVFDPSTLPLDDMAASWGLPWAPKIKFLSKSDDFILQKNRKRKPASLVSGDVSSSHDEGHRLDSESKKTKDSDSGKRLRDMFWNDDDDDDDEGEEEEKRVGSAKIGKNEEIVQSKTKKEKNIYVKGDKKVDVEHDDDELVIPAILSRNTKKPLRIRPHSLVATQSKGTHIRFDEDGEALEPLAFIAKKVGDKMGEKMVHDYTVELQERVKKADREDKEIFRKRIRTKHRAERLGKEAVEDDDDDDHGKLEGEAAVKQTRIEKEEETARSHMFDDDEDDDEAHKRPPKRRHLVEEDALNMLSGF